MADICIEDCRIPNPDLTVLGSGNASRNRTSDQQISPILTPYVTVTVPGPGVEATAARHWGAMNAVNGATSPSDEDTR